MRHIIRPIIACFRPIDPLEREVREANREYLRGERERIIDLFHNAIEDVRIFPDTTTIDVSTLSIAGRNQLCTMLDDADIAVMRIDCDLHDETYEMLNDTSSLLPPPVGGKPPPRTKEEMMALLKWTIWRA